MKTILSKLVAIVMVAVTLLSLSVPAMAESWAYSGEVIASELNIRSEPNTDSESIGSYRRGQIIVVSTCNNDSWFRVQYNGTIGYVSARYIWIRTGDFSAVVNSSDGLYLRSSPQATTSNGFEVLPNGTMVTTLHQTSGDYIRVSTPFGTGWVHQDYLYYG